MELGYYYTPCNKITIRSVRMSSSLSAVKLFQLNMKYDRHRLKISSIQNKSSPVLKREKQQMSMLSSRNAHQLYNSRFRHQQQAREVVKKNSLIHSKLEHLTRIKRPNSVKSDQLRDSMVLNRSLSKVETSRTIEQQNEKFVKKLIGVKSTISANRQAHNFQDHMRRSQMLSKFKKDERGHSVPKNMPAVQKRLRLDPVHQKLRTIESSSRVRSIHVERSPLTLAKNPIKFNSAKLLKINPQKF